MKIFSVGKLKLLTVVAVLAAAAALLFWGAYSYIPYRWKQNFRQNFLVHHQNTFRADFIRRHGFGTLAMNNLELGTNGSELLQSPKAELHWNYDWFNDSGVPGFQSLELFDCPVTVTARENDIFINGHKFIDFIQGLTRLPHGPDGKFIPLKLHALVQLGNGRAANVNMDIECISKQLINISSQWQNHSWNARLDLSNRTLTAAFSSDINIRLWQEMLLRCGLPEPGVALLADAKINGQGQFSATLPELKISNLSCNGSMEAAQLNWYGQKISNLAGFKFELEKDAPHITVAVPELTFQQPAAAKIKKLNLQYRLNSNTVQVKAQSDLRQLLVSFFCRGLNIPAFAVNSQISELTGRWNTSTHQWQVQTLAKDKQIGNLEVDASATTRLVLTPGEGEFEASGTGQNGRLLHDFDFTGMELHDSRGTCRVDKGKIFAKINFGSDNPVSEDSIEFNFANFTADYNNIHLEIPGFAGEFNLRASGKKRREIYLILRGLHSLFTGKTWKADLQSFQGTVNMESFGDLRSWQISGIDLTTNSGTAHIAGQKHSFNKAFIRGGGTVKNGAVSVAEVRLGAESAAAGKLYKMTKPQLDVDYDLSRPLVQRYKLTLSAQQALLSENPWHICSFSNGKAQFNTGKINTIPDNIAIKADALEFKNSNLTADLQRALVRIRKNTSGKFTGDANFAFMQLDTLTPQIGRGSFSHGKLTAEWMLDPQQRPTQYSVNFTSGQPVWQYNSLHTGANSCTAKIQYDVLNEPKLQGSLSMQQPTLLGKYFSAIGKELTNRFSGGSDSCSGEFQLTGATLSSPGNDIELKGTEITLPWLIAENLPDKLPEGKLTAQQLYYKQQLEGSVAAVITHGIQPSRNNKLPRNTLSIRGEAAAIKFNNKPFKFSTVWQLPPAENAMEWDFELPESKLVMPLNLTRYIPMHYSATALRGNFAMTGKVKLQDRSPVQSSLKLTAINSDWQVGNLTAGGVTTSLQLDRYNNQTILLPHNISAAGIIWQNWVLKDNELNLSSNAAGELQLAAWHGRLGTGTFKLSQVVSLDKLQSSGDTSTAGSALFDVQNIPAETFFSAVGIKYLTGNMPLTGQLRLRLQQNKLCFDRSSLSSRTPEGALLKLALPNADMLRVRNKAYQAFALAVLKAMKCTQTQFDFSAEPDEVALQVKAEGVPAAPVPFVYQGGNPPFRPADPGEEGFADEIELNINLKLHRTLPGA